jgi:alcohol dehydrogenase
VEKCAATARSSGIDSLIGLGGGSSIDTARGCNFILTNGGEMKDYWGIGKARLPMLPLIAIPTTAGTGSECQSFALISDDTTHQKMACGDPKAAARVAILDPELTLSQPASVTALTGIDALAHAVESAVTKKRNPISILYSTEAFRLICRGLPRVLATPRDLEARGLMLLGAAWAGTAIENSMLGAAHSAANPLTSQFNIVHGQAVGLMLPHVIRFNSESDETAQTYRDLLNAAGEDNQDHPGEALASLVKQFLKQAGIPDRLGALGVGSGDIPKLATEAARQWTAQHNPRPALEQDFSTLYTRAL